MLFSSLFFLYVFLPLCVLIYFLCPGIKAKNTVLLVFSMVFYAWGEPIYLLLMVAVAGANWAFGRLIGRRPERKFLTLAVVFNLLCLGVFKYTGFLLENVYLLLGIKAAAPQIALPIGISFYTFQALSYTIDVYRGQVGVQKSFAKFLLYVSLFPQLIAGPIVRYADVEREIEQRKSTPRGCFYGMTRFCIGLAKKVLLADYAGAVADQLLGGTFASSTTLGVWFGVLMYMFQIYFDFSGYSDMAIGLGRMFGFHFLENFNYPYVSKSITEFWRRWHMSLSSWFRDYVYIPLGGSREGVWKTYRNTFIVWLLTGIWHGANWTFIVWGLGYFVLLCIERLGGWTKGVRYVGHVYTMAAVVLLWVVFRADSLSLAGRYIAQMFGAGGNFWDSTAAECLAGSYVMLALAVVFSCPVVRWIADKLKLQEQSRKNIAAIAAVPLFLLCIAKCMSSSYNPFIYFNF